MMITAGLGMVDRDIEVGKEYKVGTFTLNGVTYDRYFKMVDCGTTPTNVSSGVLMKQVPIDSDYTGVLGISGIGISSRYIIPIGMYNIASEQASYDMFIDRSNILIRCPQNVALTCSQIYAILEYYR